MGENRKMKRCDNPNCKCKTCDFSDNLVLKCNPCDDCGGVVWNSVFKPVKHKHCLGYYPRKGIKRH